MDHTVLPANNTMPAMHAGSFGGYLVYYVFFVCFFVRLRISQRRKKGRGVLAYYPDRSSPLLVNFRSRGVTAAALLPG